MIALAATLLIALGLVLVLSETSSLGTPHVKDAVRETDHADASPGRRGDEVNEGASLGSRMVELRPGVVTFDVEAVVVASSTVEGARPFHTLEELLLLAAEESDQEDGSSLDIAKAEGLAVAARC